MDRENTVKLPWNSVKHRERTLFCVKVYFQKIAHFPLFLEFGWFWIASVYFVVFTYTWNRRSRFAHAQLFLARVDWGKGDWGKGSLPIMEADPVKEVLEKTKKRKAAIESRMGPAQSALYSIYIYTSHRFNYFSVLKTILRSSFARNRYDVLGLEFLCIHMWYQVGVPCCRREDSVVEIPAPKEKQGLFLSYMHMCIYICM